MNKGQIVKLIKTNFHGTALASFRIKNHAKAIVLTGSYGRGTLDKFSDVDISIMVKDDSKFNLQGKYIIDDTIFDFRTEKENEVNSNWSDAMCYAYFNCYIIMDKQGKFRKLIKDRMKDYKARLFEKIAVELVELSVLFLFKDNWRNLKSDSTHLMKALKRNRLDSAAYIQNIITEKMINLLYWVHFRPCADSKNRLRNLKKLIPLRIYKLLLRSLLLKNFTKDSLTKRDALLSEIMDYLKKEIDNVLPYNLDLKEIYLAKRD